MSMYRVDMRGTAAHRLLDSKITLGVRPSCLLSGSHVAWRVLRDENECGVMYALVCSYYEFDSLAKIWH